MRTILQYFDIPTLSLHPPLHYHYISILSMHSFIFITSVLFYYIITKDWTNMTFLLWLTVLRQGSKEHYQLPKVSKVKVEEEVLEICSNLLGKDQENIRFLIIFFTYVDVW